MVNINHLGFALNMSFIAPEYNNYNKEQFTIDIGVLSNGNWENKKIDSTTIDEINKSFYIDSIEGIECIKFNNLFYNNQVIPEAYWYIENIITQARYSYTGIVYKQYDDDTALNKVKDSVKYAKHNELWLKDFPYPAELEKEKESYYVIMFCIELKTDTKSFIIKSPDVSAKSSTIVVEKIKTENEKYKLKNGQLTSTIEGLSIDKFELVYLDEIPVHQQTGTLDTWIADYKLKNDNTLNDIYIGTIKNNKLSIARENKKILMPYENKAYFYLDAIFNNFKIYVYDGRVHSLINPVTKNFVSDTEVKDIIQAGHLKLSLVPNINVYNTSNKYSTNTLNFINSLNEKVFDEFTFLSIDSNWLLDKEYESFIVKGDAIYKQNHFTFDDSGNMYIPLVHKEWVMVKKTTLVDDNDKILRDGYLTVYAPNGTPVISKELCNVSSIPFVIDDNEGCEYLFKVNDSKKQINPNKAKLIDVNPHDIVSSKALKNIGYTQLFIPSKINRVNYNKDIVYDIEYEIEPTVDYNGWWGTVQNNVIVLDDFYSRFYHTYKDKISEPELDKTTLEMFNIKYDKVWPSDIETDTSIIPDKFNLRIKLTNLEIDNASSSFIPYQYITNKKQNIGKLVKQAPYNMQNQDNIVDVNIFANEKSSLEYAFVQNLSNSLKTLYKQQDILDASNSLKDFFITYKNNAIGYQALDKPITLNYSVPISLTHDVDDTFDISSGIIEVDIANELNCNPEDVNINLFDEITIKQKTLHDFIYIGEIEKYKPLRAEVIRDLSYTGNVKLTLDSVGISKVPAKYNVNKKLIRDIICTKSNLPLLNQDYDGCFDISITSDNVVLFKDSSNIAIGDKLTYSSLANINYLVDSLSTIPSRCAFEIIMVTFKTSGSERLNKNYIKPVFETSNDGSSIIKAYTVEKMIYTNKIKINTTLNKSDGKKEIVKDLSKQYTLFSRLFKKELKNCSIPYNWSVIDVVNDYNDKNFTATIKDDSLYISTDVQVYSYNSINYIPVETYKNIQSAVVLSKEYLLNYKPKDKYGNIYPFEDYENIQFTIIDESENLQFKWANEKSNKRYNIDDILYNVKYPVYKTYTIDESIYGVMPKNKDVLILDIDTENLRPLNDNEYYDINQTLDNVEYELTSTCDDLTIDWVDTTVNKRKGINSVIIKRR